MADFIGSTTALLKYAVASPAKEFIVVTEPGILHAMQKEAPAQDVHPRPPDANCACNECPFMKKNTLEKVYLSLRDLTPRIEMAPRAHRPRAPPDRANAGSQLNVYGRERELAKRQEAQAGKEGSEKGRRAGRALRRIPSAASWRLAASPRRCDVRDGAEVSSGATRGATEVQAITQTTGLGSGVGAGAATQLLRRRW